MKKKKRGKREVVSERVGRVRNTLHHIRDVDRDFFKREEKEKKGKRERGKEGREGGERTYRLRKS